MKKVISITLLCLAGFSASAFLFFFIRQTLTNREINLEWKNVPLIAPPLEATSQLEIIPLYEEAGLDNDFTIGHGVSYLIRTDAASVLMDVGNNPEQLSVAPFMQNMQKLGIDWNEIDRIVISHPHPDHIGGVAAGLSALLAMLVHNYMHYDELFVQAPLVALGLGLTVLVLWGLPLTYLILRRGLEPALAFHWIQDVARFVSGF